MRSIFRLAFTATLAALALLLALPFAYADSSPTHPSGMPTHPAPSGDPVTATLDATSPFTRQLIDDPALHLKIDPALYKKLLRSASDEQVPIVIEMREQVDLTRIAAAPNQRAASIVNALRAAAAQSQRDIRATLAQQRAGNIRAFWIFNGLAAHVAAQDIAALAARADVALIREDRYARYVEPSALEGVETTTTGAEWGIDRIRADEVWSALHITGTGVVIASLDSGIDWLHPALQQAYRGYNKGLAAHIGNWFDATPTAATYPIDPNGHGTHTMGTLVGADGIGVAPGAKWISGRVFDADGYAFDSWIHAGFEWILAPNGDPALAPQVLNNSWGSNSSASTVFQEDIRTLRSAGIFVVFSAGNAGPGPGTVGSPASLPEAFAVGAIDSENDAATFSSRGPSPWGDIRPHVAAPGVGVISSVPGGGYMSLNGTSMAAPHVAGTAALMLSAHSGLSISDTAYILTSTAAPLSLTLPNNDTGFGRIDAYAAVQAAADIGSIRGDITRSDNSMPIAAARIRAQGENGANGLTFSNAAGHYAYALAPSIYTVTVSAFGYQSSAQPHVIVISDSITTVDVGLNPLPAGFVRGALTDAQSGQPLNGYVRVLNTPITATATNAYSAALPAGAYQLRVTANGHRALTTTVTVTPGQTVFRNFALPRAPSILLVDSGAWYQGSQIGYYREALDQLGYLYDEHRIKFESEIPISSTLLPYDIVIWSAPLDSPGYIGAGDAISQYLSAGGSLMLSGQDVGYWDGGLTLFWSRYFYDRLKARALADNSESFALVGADIFAGLNIALNGSDSANNQNFPDVIASLDPAAATGAFDYDNGKTAALDVGLCLPYRAVYMGFGFEAIHSAAMRHEVLSRTLAYFAAPRYAVGVALHNIDSDIQIAPAAYTVKQPLTVRNIAELGGGDHVTLSVQKPAGWNVTLSQNSAQLNSCQSKTITATITAPAGAPRNVATPITVTAQSTVSPALKAQERITIKTPASVLLVDDDRFYDVESFYETSLYSNHLPFDRWDVPKSWTGLDPATPSLERLKWYAIVLWFTGYDWYQPLSPRNETTLTQYLNAGGRVFLSSQDYLAVSKLNSFGRQRLGVLDYFEDWTTTSARGVPGGPFDMVGRLNLSYTFPNYSDALAPYPSAGIALLGSHNHPIALARQTHATPAGVGKTLFFAFPFEAIDASRQAQIMRDITGYLSWLGASSVHADKAIAAPNATITVTVVARNDGPQTLTSAAFSATLPPGMSLQSGSTSWSGSLASGQAVSVTFRGQLNGSIAPGDVIHIPVTFADLINGIAFEREARVGINRADLSISSFAAQPNPAHPFDIVTWTVVARNTHGGFGAPSATITSAAPFGTQVISGSPKSGVGTLSYVSRTVTWRGSIAAGGQISFTYRISVPGDLADRLHFGDAQLDDGKRYALARAWLATQPYRFYLPVMRK
jgi:uncharacterized repeat protein (TIGR01451 family)